MGELWTCVLGTVEYRRAVALQEQLRARVMAGELPDLLLLLEHPPVYTLGRRSEPGDLPIGEDYWRAQGIDVVRTQRGGKLTYHGPGQLVGYPIMRIDRRDRLPAHDGARDRRRARRGGRSPHARATTRAPLHRRLGRGPQDRLDRRALSARRHRARVRGQRRQRPRSRSTRSSPAGCPDVRMTSIAPRPAAAGASPASASGWPTPTRSAHGLRQRLVTPRRLGRRAASVPSLA